MLYSHDTFLNRSKSIDKEIEDHYRQINLLRAQRNANSITHCIPPEILAHIFEYIIPSSELYDSRDISFNFHWIPSILHVCTLWRCLALSTPSLWTTIPLTSTLPSSQWTEFFLKHSGSALKYVQSVDPREFSRQTPKENMDSLVGLLHDFQTIASLRIERSFRLGFSDSTLEFLLSGDVWKSLRTLNLPAGRAPSCQWRKLAATAVCLASRLNALTLPDVETSWKWNVPDLQFLNLSGCSCLSVQSLSTILVCTPLLKKLCLDSLGPIPRDPVPHYAHLPHLAELEFRGPVLWAADILRTISIFDSCAPSFSISVDCSEVLLSSQRGPLMRSLFQYMQNLPTSSPGSLKVLVKIYYSPNKQFFADIEYQDERIKLTLTAQSEDEKTPLQILPIFFQRNLTSLDLDFQGDEWADLPESVWPNLSKALPHLSSLYVTGISRLGQLLFFLSQLSNMGEAHCQWPLLSSLTLSGTVATEDLYTLREVLQQRSRGPSPIRVLSLKDIPMPKDWGHVKVEDNEFKKAIDSIRCLVDEYTGPWFIEPLWSYS